VRKKKKNIILEKVLIEDYAAEGKCLAKADGKVIFIENVVPGDIADIRVIKNKNDWAEAIPLQIHHYSPERVDPFCSHFGQCGGCQWQMLPYEKQLAYKFRQVEETLKRIGKVELPVLLPILGAPETMFYRNKIEYTFGNKKFLSKEELSDPNILSGENVAGFHAKGFFDKIVDIDKCYLQEEPTNEIRIAIKKMAFEKGWTFYDSRTHSGFLRNVQIRICRTGERMVNVILGEEDASKINYLMNFLKKTFPRITTLLYTINKKWNDSINDLEPVVFSGNGYVIEMLEDFQFKIGPKSFFQTNTRQAEQLYTVARNFAELSGKEIVYDLYCGTGSIGIFVSRGASKIIGVEMIEEAIKDARENAALNALKEAEFYAGDVIDICREDFFRQHGKADVIITDPPRAGMHEKLVKKILEMEAPVVVYVSCNPATQARDLHLLDEKYKVTNVQPVDMFPHTQHIENVVQLKLSGG